MSVEHQICDRKAASLNFGKSGGRMFFSRVVCRLLFSAFHPRVIAVERKRPRSFCQRCRWRLHLNTHTPLIQQSRSGLTMPLFKHSVGTYPETNSCATHHGTLGQSSKLAEPLWTAPGLRSGIGV